MKKKILIISLDGGNWKFLNWVKRYRKLANINQFPIRGTLKSTIPAITPAAGASFQTGFNPGQTGIYDFFFYYLETKEKKIVNSSLLPETIWQKLSKAGKRVGIVNLPLTYPPQKISGIVISGILTPSLESDFTYPKKLKEKLLKAVPGYHIFNLATIKGGHPHKDTVGFVADMKEVINSRYRAASWLLKRNRFDLFMVHFQATDVVQHVLWRYLDPGCRKDEKRAQLTADFYFQLDQLIGKLIRDFTEYQKVEPLVLLISDHGFERHKKRFNLGWWLAKNGYTKLERSFFAQGFLKKIYKKLGKRSADYFNFKTSKAFSTGQSGEGFIYLIDKKIKNQLIDQLYQVIDPKTNKKIIKRVWSKEELYQGEKLDRLPDLIIEPIAGYSCSGTPREKTLFHKVKKTQDFHLGKHSPEGIVAVQGPALKSPSRLSVNILDLAPTILYYLKASGAESLDGKKMTKIL